MHCIRFESILKTKTTKEETAGPRVKRTKPGDDNDLVEREEPERKQPKTITAEAYPGALWTYILGLARAGVEELQDKPAQPRPMGRRRMTICRFFWTLRQTTPPKADQSNTRNSRSLIGPKAERNSGG